MILRGHEDYVNSVAYSPDETMAISGGRDDKLLILWDLATGKELRRFEGHGDRIRMVTFLPDGKRVLSASEDGTLMSVGCQLRDTEPRMQAPTRSRSVTPTKCAASGRCGRTATSSCPPQRTPR